MEIHLISRYARRSSWKLGGWLPPPSHTAGPHCSLPGHRPLTHNTQSPALRCWAKAGPTWPPSPKSLPPQSLENSFLPMPFFWWVHFDSCVSHQSSDWQSLCHQGCPGSGDKEFPQELGCREILQIWDVYSEIPVWPTPEWPRSILNGHTNHR